MFYLFDNNKFTDAYNGMLHLMDAIKTANMMETNLYKDALTSDCKEIADHVIKLGGNEETVNNLLKSINK